MHDETVDANNAVGVAKQGTAARAAGPSWVQAMHRHYQQFGYYRTEDLARVLGDPRKGLETRAAAGLPKLTVKNK